MANSSSFYQRGQTLLIIVLVIVVGLTIGLSIVSKSITNVRTTTEEANSAQALAAAEAGVAQAIQTNQSVTSAVSYGNNASFTTQVSKLEGQTTALLNGGNLVPQDEGADLWFVPHDNTTGVPNYSVPWPGNNMYIFWGDTASSCPSQAALEILLIKGPAGAPTSVRYALDPCSARTSGATGNNFTTTPAISVGPYNNIAGKNFSYRYSINPSGGLIARITPLYRNAVVAVQDTTGNTFPSQGSLIVATGQAADPSIRRKLNVFQGFSYLPIEYVTYGIFSPQ